ncbi:21767_t:CDS:2, partial [Gigaspora rosea]
GKCERHCNHNHFKSGGYQASKSPQDTKIVRRESVKDIATTTTSRAELSSKQKPSRYKSYGASIGNSWKVDNYSNEHELRACWLEIIQRKYDDEKIEVNSAKIQRKKTIQHQRTAVSAIALVTKEIDELLLRKCQHEEEPQIPENMEGEPLNGRLLRKTKKICYAESSSSDLEDVEESKMPPPTVHSAMNTSIATTNIVHSATNTLIMIPNKLIITKATYDEYSAYIICAFNTTIHLVKETVEKPVYEKVRNMLQMDNKLVMNDLIVKILENIFRENNPTTEVNRFTFFIRCALLDFVFMVRYLMPKVLDRDMLERSYIVECLFLVLQAFRNAFPDVKYMWLKKDVRSIKEAILMFTSNFGERKTDLLILSLCRLLGNNLDCNIEDAKNVKTYSIQVIKNRLILFAVFLAGKKKYLAVELASCIIPFTFDAITCYIRIFNFFAIIRNEFLEQEKLQRKIRAFIPTNNCSKNLREWLHLPDDDISLVTEEDMDEIFL